MTAFWISTFGLIIFITLGMPIAFSIGIASVGFVLMTNPMNLVIVPLRMFSGVNSFTLLALPFFIMSAEIMVRGGVSSRLFALANLLVGRVRGGLAYVNVVESTVFGSISGAALSDIAALGKMEIDAMVENGYDRDFSCALTAASSLQSPLIPPSSTAILYAGIMNMSVGAVLLGGLIPGILIGGTQCLYILLRGKKLNLPKVTIKYDRQTKVKIWANGLVAVGMPAIILIGIVGGVFTPTEAAAVSVLYSLGAAFLVYREAKLKDIFEALEATVKTSATLFIIVALAASYSWTLGAERIPEKIATFLLSVSHDKFVLLLMINFLLIIVGMWMETGAAIILFAPILAPIAIAAGVNPIHFSVIMILNLVIGLITPPVGVVLYATCTVGKTTLERLVKSLMPFFVLGFICLVLVTLVPDLSLFVPKLAGLVK
jgi:tripartite ATP-independent transporter DctM subunit